MADAHSDVDIGLYYRGDAPPSLDELNALARELDDRHPDATVTPFGEWGPWINGGAWLQIDGRRVDWLYREIGTVRAVIEECRAGVVTCDYQPGHPHGFHNHMYMAEVAVNVPLEDPGGALQDLKSLTQPYPEPMRRAIVDSYLWEARFAIDSARRPAKRGDVFHVSGSVFRSVACLVQVLFALNGEYFLNEKGAIAAIESFPHRPPSFADPVAQLFDRGPDGPMNPEERLHLAARLVDEVSELVTLGYPSTP